MLLALLIGCSQPIRVTVTDRWWHWEKAYTYLKPYSVMVQGKMQIRYRPATRCAAHLSGRALPATEPPTMPCDKQDKDNERNIIGYSIVYQVNNELQQAAISQDAWADFEIGSTLTVTISSEQVASELH